MSPSTASVPKGGRVIGKIGSTVRAEISIKLRIGRSKAVPKEDTTTWGLPEGTCMVSETISALGEATVQEGPASFARGRGTLVIGTSTLESHVSSI